MLKLMENSAPKPVSGTYLLCPQAVANSRPLPEYSQPHPQLKDGTVYRQDRPTKLDKIKNLSHQVRVGGVVSIPTNPAENFVGLVRGLSI